MKEYQILVSLYLLGYALFENTVLFYQNQRANVCDIKELRLILFLKGIKSNSNRIRKEWISLEPRICANVESAQPNVYLKLVLGLFVLACLYSKTQIHIKMPLPALQVPRSSFFCSMKRLT